MGKKKPIQLKISRTHKPDHLELEEWQSLLRKEYGQKQPFKLKNLGDHPLFLDFSVTNPETDKTYMVAIRGAETGMLTGFQGDSLPKSAKGSH